jgi:hypothetical protein
MAAGDLTVYEEAYATISNLHDLDADTIKLALITVATVPTAADATPALADYTEVTAGGNYTAGGTDISATFTEAGGTATFDGTDVTWTQNAGNPTDARYAIVHDTTTVGAIAFIDLGATIDMTATDLTVAFNASGIFTIS